MALPTASDNEFPKVILEEVANDGSATVTPAADHRALFLGEDGGLRLKDSAAAVTDVGGDAAAHIADATDAHDASAISIVDSGGHFTGTDVEAALQELGAGGSGGVTVVRKSANEVVNGSSTLQNDDHLLLALGVSEVWAFEFVIFHDSGTTPDIKMAITVPAGATLAWGSLYALATGGSSFTGTTETVSGTSRDFATAGVGVTRIVTLTGYVANGANAGNLQLQWAQNTSNGTDTTVHANSILKAWQLV